MRCLSAAEYIITPFGMYTCLVPSIFFYVLLEVLKVSVTEAGCFFHDFVCLPPAFAVCQLSDVLVLSVIQLLNIYVY